MAKRYALARVPEYRGQRWRFWDGEEFSQDPFSARTWDDQEEAWLYAIATIPAVVDIVEVEIMVQVGEHLGRFTPRGAL